MTTLYDEWAMQQDEDKRYKDAYQGVPLSYSPAMPLIAPPAGSKNSVSECLINCYKIIELLEKQITELTTQNSRYMWLKSAAEVLAKNTAEENKKLREQVDKLNDQMKKLNEYDKFDIMDVE